MKDMTRRYRGGWKGERVGDGKEEEEEEEEEEYDGFVECNLREVREIFAAARTRSRSARRNSFSAAARSTNVSARSAIAVDFPARGAFFVGIGTTRAAQSEVPARVP